MNRKRNITAHKAWMDRKREGRPRQIWVPWPGETRGGDWLKVGATPEQRLLGEIFGGVEPNGFRSVSSRRVCRLVSEPGESKH